MSEFEASMVPESKSLPLLPLRDIVVFPNMIVPLFVGRDKSVVALEKAMDSDKEIFLVAQLDPAEDDPARDQLYDLGVVATVLQLLKLPDGTVRVLVEGKQRAKHLSLENKTEGYVLATIDILDEQVAEGTEASALMRSVAEQFENYSKLNKKMPAETVVQLGEIDDSSRLADAVAANIQCEGCRQAESADGERSHQTPRNGFCLHGRRTGCVAGREKNPWPGQASDGEDSA